MTESSNTIDVDLQGMRGLAEKAFSGTADQKDAMIHLFLQWCTQADERIRQLQMEGLIGRLPESAPQDNSLLSENRRLRREWCAAYAGASAYMDDGEAQDSRYHPNIDFLRDPIPVIKEKMQARSRKVNLPAAEILNSLGWTFIKGEWHEDKAATYTLALRTIEERVERTSYQIREFREGDVVLASPVGEGKVTSLTERGYPRVNGIAVVWFIRDDGVVFNPHNVPQAPNHSFGSTDYQGRPPGVEEDSTRAEWLAKARLISKELSSHLDLLEER